MSDHIKIRQGGADDVPAVLALFDGAVEWLVSQGRTGQWGTRPWSQNPKAVALVEKYLTTGEPWIAEIDGEVVGTVTLTDGPGGDIIPAADEPERYIHLLAADHRRFAGRGVGRALLAHAVEETRRQGVRLLRVDCYRGEDRALVRYYESNGFTATEPFTGPDGSWPGQVLAQRV
ncbi:MULTISPECIES: GNAT family N-acetyltransferase [Streptomyces]|uniref:GNAT family N-acetyltransferase n=1 Tax=Streptomyces venezuelae TaxID=54571 RepID=A0A5P2BBK5_STRVZ|nr:MULTISPECIES: GNAT family N-acetyltransferase [Streptomyces]MYY82789.1 GNAT family N-acetyltransferase [Streptomyces sp. SID335]MYZ19138.1 GNAT family N-acetyltransferase [Streptomyces sp. SID337]NDZ88416.1 GNAT family N-acetyltransferase [Streptomyces sp. SID10115]NEB49259.1 GNAT family N-acetyltransferase [Streptomyces sp. SID339]QES27892.1 GNAT family N-acetyltransferase [Streptomyces venezuelae]